MKKLILLFVIFTASFAARAQVYKSFRVGVGLGYASPQGDGAKAGVLFYLEPSYRLSDAFAIGLRAEWAVMLRNTTFNTTANGTTTSSGNVSGSGSYTVNGQYYFGSGRFRPFVGAGVGVYKIASAAFTDESSGNNQAIRFDLPGDVQFGFYPRIGFDASHFTFNIEYNIVPTSTKSFQYLSVYTGALTTGTRETNNNYLGVKIGWFIGGGKKIMNLSK